MVTVSFLLHHLAYKVTISTAHSSKGVQKIYKFNSDEIPPPQQQQRVTTSTFVFFISTDLSTFKLVLDQIHRALQALTSTTTATATTHLDDIKMFHIISCPTVLYAQSVQLEQEGLHGFVQLHRFNWDFITLDTDLMSLECTQLYRQLFVKEDSSLLSSVAHSFRVFTMVFGTPNIVLTHGAHAEMLWKMVDRMETESKVEPVEAAPDFNAMLLMDRNKDYPSCLLTPVVYAGLLHELFPVHSGSVQMHAGRNKINENQLNFLQRSGGAAVATAANKPETTTLRLNGMSDQIYRINRYKHFSEVVQLLSAQAKALGMEGRNLKGMELREMQEYVANKLPQVTTQKKELFKHLIMCETIVAELGGNFEQIQQLEESMLLGSNRKTVLGRINEALSIDAHKYNSLRHICLLYLTCGLSTDEATTFIGNYLNAFGYRHLPMFLQLMSAKLFPEIDVTTATATSAAASAKVAAVNLLLSNINLRQNPFQIDANKLKLIQADRPEVAKTSSEPTVTCPSYVFSGSYRPFVAQICNFLLNSERFEEFFGKCGHLDAMRVAQYSGGVRKNVCLSDVATAVKAESIPDIFPLKPRTIFVYVIGGVTYAEVAASQLVARMAGATIVVASDSITSSSDIVAAAF